jgi:hypothetical protein
MRYRAFRTTRSGGGGEQTEAVEPWRGEGYGQSHGAVELMGGPSRDVGEVQVAARCRLLERGQRRRHGRICQGQGVPPLPPVQRRAHVLALLPGDDFERTIHVLAQTSSISGLSFNSMYQHHCCLSGTSKSYHCIPYL